jgi:hypothetical protein
MAYKHSGKLALVIAIGCGAYWFHLAHTVAAAPPAPAAAIRTEARSSAPNEHQWMAGTALTMAASKAQPLPLSEQLDRLILTHKPEDAFQAYWLIQDCISFEEVGDLYTAGAILPGAVAPQRIGLSDEGKKKTAALCHGLTERMRSSRLDYLAAAAKGKVRTAALVFYFEGPFGDKSALVSRPNDPLVLEWKQQAVSQLSESANEGNTSSMFTLMMEFREGSSVVQREPLRSLTYLLALRKIQGSEMFSDALFPPDPALTPEQVATAEKDAQAIAAAHARWRAQLHRKG